MKTKLSDRKLKNLGARLQKIDDNNGQKQQQALEKVADWNECIPLLWHLIDEDLVAAEKNLGMLRLLSEKLSQAPSADAVTDLVCRLPSRLDELDFPPKHPLNLLCEYPFHYDRLLFFAYRNDKENLLQRVEELSEPVRLGLYFVQRRSGEEIPHEQSAQILTQLARCQCEGYSLILRGGVSLVRDGEEVHLRIEDLGELRELATLVGSDEKWDRALVDAGLKGLWINSPQIADAIRAARPEELVPLLRGGKDSNLLRTSTLESAVLGALADRQDDDPDTLLNAALELLDSEKYPPEELCELLGLYIAAIYGKSGETPPEELDRLFTGGFIRNDPGRIKLALKGFAALPRERALALARKGLQGSGVRGRDLLPLAVHFDQSLVDAYLEKDNKLPQFEACFVGAFGLRLLPLLKKTYAATNEARDVAKGILFAISQLDDPTEDLEEFITFGGTSNFRPEDAALHRRAFARFPRSRQKAMVERAIDEEIKGIQILEVVAETEDPELIELAVNAVLQSWQYLNWKRFRELLAPLGDVEFDLLERLVPHAADREHLFRLSAMASVYGGRELERLKKAAHS